MSADRYEVGDYLSDPSSPGRVVKVVTVFDRSVDHSIEVETVQPAHGAVSTHAVGRRSVVKSKTARRFRYLGNDCCRWCSHNSDHRKSDGSYACPVIG